MNKPTSSWLRLVRVAGVLVGLYLISAALWDYRQLLLSDFLFSFFYALVAAAPLISPWRRVRWDFLWLLLFVILCLDFGGLLYLVISSTRFVFRFRESLPVRYPVLVPVVGCVLVFVVAMQIPVVLSIRRHRLLAVAELLR